MAFSSSTMSRVCIRLRWALGLREGVLVADDAADDEEPEAISGSFGSVEGFEDGSHDFGGHPSAVVADGKGDLVFV